MQKNQLYFIAIIPPHEICDEITSFKMDLANRFASKKALKLMPHITLKAPFSLPGFEHLTLLHWFQKLMITVMPFEIELKGFGFFYKNKSPVIYIQPIMNLSLIALQNEINQSFRQAYPAQAVIQPELKFNPHITIAYRDLKPKMFEAAWEEYQLKKYAAKFEIDRLNLLQHNGETWYITSTIFLTTTHN